jgi:hypothetical protein
MRANEAGSARYKNHAIALLKNGDLGSEEEIHRTESTRYGELSDQKASRIAAPKGLRAFFSHSPGW